MIKLEDNIRLIREDIDEIKEELDYMVKLFQDMNSTLCTDRTVGSQIKELFNKLHIGAERMNERISIKFQNIENQLANIEEKTKRKK